ncbi:hypothetical protein [Streptomyces sp. NPDC127098]|uniref:hypothetical protein n=1 Tax=Streptomyces sp. NPDC127098 TaxID=3347137 RepID=UPI003660BA49
MTSELVACEHGRYALWEQLLSADLVERIGVALWQAVLPASHQGRCLVTVVS